MKKSLIGELNRVLSNTSVDNYKIANVNGTITIKVEWKKEDWYESWTNRSEIVFRKLDDGRYSYNGTDWTGIYHIAHAWGRGYTFSLDSNAFIVDEKGIADVVKNHIH